MRCLDIEQVSSADTGHKNGEYNGLDNQTGNSPDRKQCAAILHEFDESKQHNENQRRDAHTNPSARRLPIRNPPIPRFSRTIIIAFFFVYMEN